MASSNYDIYRGMLSQKVKVVEALNVLTWYRSEIIDKWDKK